MKYVATYAFNIRRFIKREFEATSHDEARRIADAHAWPDIDADIMVFQNSDNFADTDNLNAWLMLDTEDGDVIAETMLDEPEQPEPKPLGEQFGTDPETGQPTIILGS